MPPNSEPTVSDIYYKLGGLEGKLDAHHQSIAKELEVTSGRLNDHAQRIGVLERGAAKTAGILLAVVVGVEVVFSLLTKFIGAQ